MFKFNSNNGEMYNEYVADKIVLMLSDKITKMDISDEDKAELLSRVSKGEEDSLYFAILDAMGNGVVPSKRFFDKMQDFEIDEESLGMIFETFYDLTSTSTIENFCQQNIFNVENPGEKLSPYMENIKSKLDVYKRYLSQGHAITNSLVNVDWHGEGEIDESVLSNFYLKTYGMNWCFKDMLGKKNVWEWVEDEQLGDIAKTMFAGVEVSSNDILREIFVRQYSKLGLPITSESSDLEINTIAISYMLDNMQQRILSHPDQMSIYYKFNEQEQSEDMGEPIAELNDKSFVVDPTISPFQSIN